ncbi:MAG: hypothetical protein ACTSYL_01695 [Candidatus Thorarchaeota archaeon]
MAGIYHITLPTEKKFGEPWYFGEPEQARLIEKNDRMVGAIQQQQQEEE